MRLDIHSAMSLDIPRNNEAGYTVTKKLGDVETSSLGLGVAEHIDWFSSKLRSFATMPNLQKKNKQLRVGN